MVSSLHRKSVVSTRARGSLVIQESEEDLVNVPLGEKRKQSIAYEKQFTNEFSDFDQEGSVHDLVPETAEDLVTNVIQTGDDPSLSPWTFRTFIIGIGLSMFGSVLSTIYYFKPQTVGVSTIFLAVISYILGEAFAKILPSRGVIGRFLNPGKFNQKEHAAIVIMASSAANCALGAEVLAVQKLWYNSSPGPLLSIFILISSQLLGYGMAGLLRATLVYPTKMLYPSTLPIVTLLQTLHRDKKETSVKLKFFYIVFFALFCWEVVPEYMFPLATGFSVFCLANPRSSVFTTIFGGSNGNEGLGLLSICLDWQYIGGSSSPLWMPLQTLSNNLVGYVLCIIVFAAVFYGNIWRALDFPFLSQLLYSQDSSPGNSIQYNQTSILDSNMELDRAALETVGIPFFSTTYAVYILVTNLAITATFSHMLLWNWDDLKSAWEWATPSAIKNMKFDFRFWKAAPSSNSFTDAELEKLDPHYRLMLAYKDVPNWWYMLTMILSIIIGLVCTYAAKSTLPWWGFLVSSSLGLICVLFFSAQYAITGFAFIIQPLIQMLGGYLHPGKPLANMYFTLYGYNSVSQAQLLLKDLKFAQYAKLSPRCTFFAQFAGTILGAILNYIMMVSIVTNQREILLSVEGTNIWSGQNVQQYNSQAIAWGGLAKDMFSVGSRYQWVTLAFPLGFLVPLPLYFLHKAFPKMRFEYWNTAIISYYIGFLCVGINSSLTTFFIVGFTSQFYLRKYHADWFIKYNYILSAAMDGGTQVIVFILTFAVFGGSGASVPFPKWWGNNSGGNFDRCLSLN